MPATVSTDQELDMILAMRLASMMPLPPEVSMVQEQDSRKFFQWSYPFEFLGLTDHPLYNHQKNIKLKQLMANTISHANYLDRLSHYSSYLNGSTLEISDLTGPVQDDPI